jgi:outer membrane protein assembly factor BamB
VIDDRIRVYAKKREVWSDGPASYHYERSAYWAYRRWPAEVTGVVAVKGNAAKGKGNRPLVITAWSDGMLVAIDAEAGTVAWRVQTVAVAPNYTGRRTGTETVYTPTGLLGVGRRIMVMAGEQVIAYEAESGRAEWTAPVPVTRECRGTVFTSEIQLLIHDTCSKTLARLDLLSGQLLPDFEGPEAVEPVSCQVGHTTCAAMRVTSGGSVTGWVITGKEPVPSFPLAEEGSLYTGESVIIPQEASLSAVDMAGNVLWTWHPAAAPPFRLLAASTTRVVVLESDGTLVSLDPATGRFKSYASIIMEHERDKPYEVNALYASGRYLALERVNWGVPATASDDEYYYTNRSILLAATGE